MNVLGYRCSLCGAEYALDAVPYICPQHGEAGNLDIVLDYAAIGRLTSPAQIAASRDFSLWRYLPLLPVQDPGLAGTPLRNAGWTPLYRADRLAQDLKLKHVFLKDDGRNPTASFKDRASAVVVARAREIGAATVTTASSGNAAAALAGMAASAGLPTVIFVPHTAPQAKVTQLLMYGARVFLVQGTYDDAFDLTLKAAREFGWYCRNTGYNPFTREGKKTAAFEIAEQFTALGSAGLAGAAPKIWQVPDWVFVSVGDGNIISGIHKGFQDMLALGWIDRLPKLVGIQAEGSPAVHDAWASGGETIAPRPAETIADSISVGLPRDGVRAVRAARETGGGYLTVSDREILHSMRALARHGAVFAEPAAATAYAGLGRAACDGLLHPDDSVVVVITGNGLKDIKSAIQAAAEPAVPVEPSLAALRRALAGPPANP